MSKSKDEVTSSSSAKPPTWRNYNRRGQVPKYIYETIKDLQSSDNPKKVHNVYGVVIDNRSTEKSKGSDFFCLLRIVDPSFCQDEGVKVTLFHQDQKFLPNVDQGDIIRLHRIKARDVNGSLSLMSSKGWSWTFWKGQVDDDDLQNANSCSTTCTIVDADVERVKSLRQWVAKEGYAGLDVVRNSQENNTDQKLSDVKSGSFFNLTCQVAGMCKVHENFVVLKIWDGTLPSHKIEPGAYAKDSEVIIMHGFENLLPYVVDVSVFDNHVQDIKEIVIGSFVRFFNLHALAKNPAQNNEQCQTNEESSELLLHGGTVFNRGIVMLDENDEKIQNLKEQMRNLVTEGGQIDASSTSHANNPGCSKTDNGKSVTPQKRKLEDLVAEHSPAGSSGSEAEFSTPPEVPMKKFREELGLDSGHAESQRDLQSQDLNGAKSQDTLAILSDMNTVIGNKSDLKQNQLETQEDKPTVDSSLSIESSQTIVNGESFPESFCTDVESQDMRCHQKSTTVVFGPESPFRISKIVEVLKAEVPVRESCLFRVRAKIVRTSSADDIVCHFCPATGLRFGASNDGQRIKLSDNAYKCVCACRQRFSLDEVSSSGEGGDESQSVTSTQWPVVVGNEDEGDHVNVVDMQKYEYVKDGSKWETLKFKSSIMRKRKKEQNRFNILYCEDNECTANLKTVGKNFQRVVRVCSKESLTSQEIPAMVYQDGVYYYCSPACIENVAIPPLEEEAKAFNRRKPLYALGCPLMPLYFHLDMLLQDDTAFIGAVLKGQSAIDFFNGVTPQLYFLDPNGCRQTIVEKINQLTKENEAFAEMIIEKKSRRPLCGNNKPVILYEIVNTKLCI